MRDRRMKPVRERHLWCQVGRLLRADQVHAPRGGIKRMRWANGWQQRRFRETLSDLAGAGRPGA